MFVFSDGKDVESSGQNDDSLLTWTSQKCLKSPYPLCMHYICIYIYSYMYTQLSITTYYHLFYIVFFLYVHSILDHRITIYPGKVITDLTTSAILGSVSVQSQQRRTTWGRCLPWKDTHRMATHNGNISNYRVVYTGKSWLWPSIHKTF